MEEETTEKLEAIANGLRGVCFDPALPQHIKEYVLKKVAELDSITEEGIDE